jgi:hypothetical protein
LRVSNQQERKQKATIHLPVHKKDASVGLETTSRESQRGLVKKEVSENYEKRLKEMKLTTEESATATSSTETTKDIVQLLQQGILPSHNLCLRLIMIARDVRALMTCLLKQTPPTTYQILWRLRRQLFSQGTKFSRPTTTVASI